MATSPSSESRSQTQENGNQLEYLFGNMSISNNDTVGYDLIHELVKDDIHCKQDILIILFHTLLINRGYRVIHSQEDVAGVQETSETLPGGWNRNSSFYTLRYLNMRNKRVYELQVVLSCNDNIVVNFLDTDNITVRTASMNVSRYVKKMDGSLMAMVPKYADIIAILSGNLLRKERSVDSHSQVCH
ncbi:proteasome inhibitor PI31 subunit-like [Nilaparvata lugens]|uniref:proteasome inhibitor PI31 subunit-like n=1 Tax=Nilaparvata lugens TaxID=108931 RepID=UPI00193C8DE9|nr:proteasome inhibitor PI31 subunit-like [Nilaparvata lugens]